MLRVSILDEPTSGLDPETRREIWDILLELRKERSIMITTHCMEETQALADYIFIMSKGSILCQGTIQKLKKTYAPGYLLKLLTNDHFQSNGVMKIVYQYVPEAKIVSFVQPTFIVSLPYRYVPIYPELLRDLELSVGTLGVAAISVTDSTMDDVFLNCDIANKDTAKKETDTQSGEEENLWENIDSISHVCLCAATNLISKNKLIPTSSRGTRQFCGRYKCLFTVLFMDNPILCGCLQEIHSFA